MLQTAAAGRWRINTCLQIVVLLLAAVSTQSQTPINTNGKTIHGYKFRKDITYYRNLSVYIGKILKYINQTPPNWTAAKNVYVTQNKPKTLKIFAQARNGNWTFEPMHNLYKRFYGGSVTFVDDWIGKFNDAIKVEVGLQWTMFMLIADQLDSCKLFVLDNTFKIQTGIREIDDTAGIYIGYDEMPTFWNFHDEVARKWKSCAPRKSINERVPPILMAMRDQAIANVGKGESSWSTWDGLYNQFWQVQITGLSRAILYRVGQKSVTSKARAAAYLRMFQPQLVDRAAAKKLQDYLSVPKTIADVAKVVELLRNVITAQNIPVNDVFC